MAEARPIAATVVPAADSPPSSVAVQQRQFDTKKAKPVPFVRADRPQQSSIVLSVNFGELQRRVIVKIN